MSARLFLRSRFIVAWISLTIGLIMARPHLLQCQGIRRIRSKMGLCWAGGVIVPATTRQALFHAYRWPYTPSECESCCPAKMRAPNLSRLGVASV